MNKYRTCKVGICGHFGENKNLLNGQTIKTKILTEELIKEFGKSNIKIVDSHDWKKKPIRLLTNCFRLIKECRNIIILPAHNGIKVFIPLFYFLNKLFYRKLHYVVIGGWLPDFLEKNSVLTKFLMKFDEIYVETNIMIEKLRRLGLQNVRYLPNFKRLDILKETELIYNNVEPYRLCTFSRVMKEKGIEDAIEVVKKINENKGKIIYSLDIYGQIDDGYKERFEKLKKEFPPYIKYVGYVEFNKSVEVLKSYFALLFPTRFKTEGIPGSIIDAYAAGIPVIASNWDSAVDIIEENMSGLIYEFEKTLELEKLLLMLANESNKIIQMKNKCLNKAKTYSSEIVINQFIKYLK